MTNEAYLKRMEIMKANALKKKQLCQNFISIEGPEGSGKTTICSMIRDYIENKGRQVLITREPGGVELAEKIRLLIMENEMDGQTEALLYAAARREHLVNKIIPALEQGVIVICDRFVDSSVVYQGYARGIGMDIVDGVNKIAIQGFMPKYTLFLDIEPSEGLKRIHQNKNREVNRFDEEDLTFHRKVYEGYKMCEGFRCEDRFVGINANQSVEKVFSDVCDFLDNNIDL